jgi:hypothetical protein
VRPRRPRGGRVCEPEEFVDEEPAGPADEWRPAPAVVVSGEQ